LQNLTIRYKIRRSTIFGKVKKMKFSNKFKKSFAAVVVVVIVLAMIAPMIVGLFQ